MAALRQLYPAIEPYNSGMLEVGDGHSIFFEESGTPSGLPAVFLHGGPGGGCSPHSRCFFDPQVYRIVTFDQRGCNRSVPNAADDWAAAIHGNNTQCLVADVERLRSHLAVEAWHVVLGGSWGSTLALAYAQAHPSKLKAIVLRGVFLFLPQEVDNLFQDGSTALNHPEAWELYVDHIRASSPSAEAFALEEVNLLAAYYSRLVSQDAETRLAAAAAFVKYELTISKTFPDAAKVAKVMATPSILVPFALFEAHYMLHGGFLRRGQLLDDAKKQRPKNGRRPKNGVCKIRHLPIQIVHGRCDYVCRPLAAWRLHKALKLHQAANAPDDKVKMELIDGAGHSDTEPGIVDALVRATDDRRGK